ncbi:MAG: AraC family ligand binding domain-containing protein [Victivallales bacterium]|nr:AraC family ligand binding domain-containing protein [Victivallales bacterium]
MQYGREELHIRTGAFWSGDCPGGWVEANRKLYDYELVYFSRGSCRVSAERMTFDCGEGDVLVIPPSHEHCSMTVEGCTRWCIHFDWFGTCPLYATETLPFVYLDGDATFDQAQAARAYPGASPRFPALFHFERQQSAMLLSWMRQFFGTATESLGDSLTRQGVFLQILGLVLEHENRFVNHFSKGSHFLQAKRYLDKHFARPMLQMREVAASLLITPNHLNKLFR